MKIVKWIGAALGVLILLAGLGFGAAYVATELRLSKTYDIKPETITVPTDAESIEHGKHLITSLGGCSNCHGADLGGTMEEDMPPIVALRGPNLTAGEGSVTAKFTDADWVRAIRHGVKPDGKPLFFMPASAYINLSERDLGSIIAAAKTFPPVNRTMAPSTLYPVGRILAALHMLPLTHAELVDHSTPMPAAVTSGTGAAFGKYAVNAGGCRDCHRADLSGGRIPGVPKSIPPPVNLTPVGPLAKYTEADFRQLFRTGKRPNGTPLHEMMPWKAIGKASDEELNAIFAYLKTVPAAQTQAE
jgi:cytochrome c553